jgi:hypothetical protein
MSIKIGKTPNDELVRSTWPSVSEWFAEAAQAGYDATGSSIDAALLTLAETLTEKLSEDNPDEIGMVEDHEVTIIAKINEHTGSLDRWEARCWWAYGYGDSTDKALYALCDALERTIMNPPKDA